MAQALTGLKTGYETAMKANDGKWPSVEQVAAAMREMQFKAFGGTVKMREDGQGLEDQMLGVTKKVDAYPFMIMDKMMLVPGSLVTAPVGTKSVQWVKTLKPEILQDAQLKSFER